MSLQFEHLDQKLENLRHRTRSTEREIVEMKTNINWLKWFVMIGVPFLIIQIFSVFLYLAQYLHTHTHP